jgi:hypothetical protein
MPAFLKTDPVKIRKNLFWKVERLTKNIININWTPLE